ncbi:hypothetical protein [Spiroplasma cantharicola]|uniref:Uncharacterized protein n=1 Tax=Spiroplasma cantharicola TaxID=362837 RepID=A0A0M3SJD1_9MOLU|nr:hypothetical protein [Spiroplasma cantharicola]ALD66524.1 hypothetical protein SCANT_v1c06180 [Spiroplasma cantharicola]
MLKKILSNEEKKVFSEKSKKDMKNKNYEKYMKFEIAYLESLKENGGRSKLRNKFLNEKNKYLDETIETQEDLVGKLRLLYESEMSNKSNEKLQARDEMFEETEDFEKMIKEIDKILSL